MHTQEKNPLHGVKLEEMLKELVATYGREDLAEKTTIKCMNDRPTIKSILKFLRNVEVEWARIRIEELYIQMKE